MNQKSSTRVTWLPGAVVLVVLIIITSLFFVFRFNQSNQPGQVIETTMRYYPLIATSPVTNAEELYLYNMVTGVVTKTGIATTLVEVSPDLELIAYLDTNRDLRILNSKTNENLLIKSSSEGDYLQDYLLWSPDSRYLLSKGFIGNSYEDERYSHNVWDRNTQITSTLSLANGLGIDTFIDAHRILLTPSSAQGYEGNLAVYDLTTKQIDPSINPGQAGFGVGQFNFTPDGQKWTYTFSEDPTNDANIMVADFPKRDGAVIASGKWAEVQGSVLSPAGSKVAYRQSNKDKGSGVVIYDLVNNTSLGLFAGFGSIDRWLSDELIILRSYDSLDRYSHSANLHFINVNTGATQGITSQLSANDLNPPKSILANKPVMVYTHSSIDQSDPDLIKAYDLKNGDYSILATLDGTNHTLADNKIYFISSTTGQLTAYDLNTKQSTVIPIPNVKPLDEYTKTNLVDFVIDTGQIIFLRGNCYESATNCSLEKYNLLGNHHELIMESIRPELPAIGMGATKLVSYDAQTGIIIVNQAAGDAGWSYTSYYEVKEVNGAVRLLGEANNDEGNFRELVNRFRPADTTCGEAKVDLSQFGGFRVEIEGKTTNFNAKYLDCWSGE